MIGGNGYFGQKPDPELLVRWAQVRNAAPLFRVVRGLCC
jgi:alpha-glucosidase (family GH31 glycosyl hydrolase)